MNYVNLKVMDDFSEIIHYENSNLPLYISRAYLSIFSNMKTLGHWHDDIEIAMPINGNISYDVNGQKFFISEGDAIIVNAQQMHYTYSADGNDGEYLCILFQPKLLTGSNFILEKYINPIIRHPYITETLLSRDNPKHIAVINAIDKFRDIPKVNGYELEFLTLALELWTKWFEFLNVEPLISYKTVDSGIDIQKRMVEFVYKNYHKKISLSDIAKAGNVCKSVCCQLFKRYLGKTPIDFVNSYRLQRGMQLISDSKMSITEIAGMCGFNSSSYFSEMFLKAKGCTPSAYRISQREII